jgi:hypothetical protein
MKDEREDMEWINEYQTLKQVNPANPFAVPDNYFSEMEGQVMAQIRLDGFKAEHPDQAFKVPENYFNELEQNIQSRIVIDEVLSNDKGFTVPADYFNQLEQNIQSRIAIDEILNNDKGFTVPADYFNQLEQNIQSRIAIDELLNNEPSFTIPTDYFNELEQNIQSRIAIEQHIEEESFAVPAGYFEALESKILQQTTLQAGNAVVKEERGMVVKLWTKHAFKYASAACFSLIMGTGLFLSEFNTTSTGSSHQHSYLHKVVAKIPDDEIETFLQLNTTDASPALNNTDASDLEAIQAAQGDEIKN